MPMLRRLSPLIPALALFGSLAGCQMHVAIGTPHDPVGQLFGAATDAQPPRTATVKAAQLASAPVANSADGNSPGVALTAGQLPARARVTRIEEPDGEAARGLSLFKRKSELRTAGNSKTPDTLPLRLQSVSAAKLEIPPSPTIEASATSIEESTASYPIDLPSALRLSGGENWDIQIATEKVHEARAKLDAAKLLWLPSLNAGIGYNKHEGQIQATPGQVVDVSRNSLFVGGGAVVSDAPTAGGSGGPSRLQVDLSIADAIFTPLAARQTVQAEQARESAAFNDILRDTATAYFQLVAANGRGAVARQNLDDTQKLQELTNSFVVAGRGSEADNARIRVETSRREQDIIRAEVALKVASVELARILRLGSATELIALEEKPIAVEFVSEDESLAALIARAQMYRPEMAESQAEVQADQERMRAERWRPFLPNVHVGVSSGGFGGGVNDNLQNFDGRADFDVLAVWQLRNLGLGARAAQLEQRSRLRQSMLANSRIQDIVAADVATAYHQVHAQRKQLELTEKNVELAQESYQKNIARIRGLEGLPLEALQALQMLGTARDDYILAVYGYNQAQVRLQHAIGRRPVDTPSAVQPIADPPPLTDPELTDPRVELPPMPTDGPS